MEFDKKTQSEKTEKYKFCDRFLHKFDVLAKAYDAELKTLRSIEKEIKDTSHGVCNSGYNVRYITPSDISTYVANFDKALAAGLLQPSVGDCNLFAVESVKKFIEANGCIPFDMPTVGGTKNTTPTMADLGDLELIVANETFKKNVYSTSELKTRTKYVKEDLKKFESMHFTAAVRSLISKLPTIIEKHSESACSCTDIKCKHELGVYVGNFILFALKLNLLSLEQMRLYTVPQVTFDTCSDRERKVTSLTVQEYTKMFEEDGESLEVYQEAVNVKDKQPIFFVFSKGIAPILSKSIMKFTNSKFSHMGIAFSPDCRKIYTYTSRGEHRENYVSGETGFGFTIDSINDLKQNNQEIAIMVGYISNGNYEIIKEQIEDFTRHNTTFDATLFLNYLRNKPIKNKNKYAQVCSTFCDYILKSIGITVSNEPVPSPGGMKEQLDKSSEKLNNVFEVFSGKAQEYIPETAEIEVARFAARDRSRAFDEMYTECYHITKVDSEVRSIIPFGLNFRDIALSDDHEYYKNTCLALKYVMSNPRSPFNQILNKYFDPDEPQEKDEAHSLLRMMFGEWMNRSDYDDPYHRPDVQFPSDPNWMDKIMFGNAYYDLNYRRDNPGNQTSDPITAKFDVICKMFMPCCHETDSKKLVKCAMRIANVMEAIIDVRKNDEWSIPRQLSTEFLALLGDILTRVLMKLYHLNTVVFDFSDTMRDTMIPGILYEESGDVYTEDENGNVVLQEAFILEADEAPKAMVVSNTKESDMGNVAKAKHTFAQFWAKIQEWWNGVCCQYFSNWEKTQEKMIKWINDNKSLVDEISKALGDGNGAFQIKVSNYVQYNIQMEPISNLKPEEVVNKFISERLEKAADGTTTVNQEVQGQDAQTSLNDVNAYIKQMYPEAIAQKMLNTQTDPTNGTADATKTANNNTDENRTKVLVNYVLYNSQNGEEPKVEDSVNLTGAMLNDIYANLTGTQSGISKVFNTYNEKVKKANSLIQQQLTKSEQEAAKAAAAKNVEKTEAVQNSDGETAAKVPEKTETEAAKAERKSQVMIAFAREMSRAEKVVSQGLTNAIIGCPKNNKDYAAYKNSFWGKNYQILSDVVREYKTRDKNANASSTTTDTNTTNNAT